MSSLDIFFLHGFLGNSSDGNQIERLLRERLSVRFQCQVHLIDYLKKEDLNPQNNYAQFAKNFCEYVGRKNCKGKKILIGYSLGGRLALHVLKEDPSLFDQFFLISCHTGLVDIQEKKIRLENDDKWARRFLNEDLKEVVAVWNQQPVFNLGKIEPIRSPHEDDRKVLALALREWSLGKQQDLSHLLLNYRERIHYCVGLDDSKFLGFAKEKIEPILKSRCHFIKNSGHRIIFDNPLALVELICSISI